MLPVECIADRGLGGVEDCECPVAAFQGLEPELQALLRSEAQALHAQFILVHCNQLAIHEDGFGLRTHRTQVIAQNEGRGHHAPHSKVGTVLVHRHAIAYFEHVGVVPMSGACILAQRLAEAYALHDTDIREALRMHARGIEIAPDIRPDAPAMPDVAGPEPRLIAAPFTHAQEDGAP